MYAATWRRLMDRLKNKKNQKTTKQTKKTPNKIKQTEKIIFPKV